MRLLHTHPLTCNPQRLPHELAGVYSDTIQAWGNAKGTLCKREITTAKSLPSSSLTLLCPHSVSLSQTDTHTHTHTHRIVERWHWHRGGNHGNEKLLHSEWQDSEREDFHSVHSPCTEDSSLRHYAECYKFIQTGLAPEKPTTLSLYISPLCRDDFCVLASWGWKSWGGLPSPQTLKEHKPSQIPWFANFTTPCPKLPEDPYLNTQRELRGDMSPHSGRAVESESARVSLARLSTWFRPSQWEKNPSEATISQVR